MEAAVLGLAPASCAADAQSREACRRRASSTGSARRRQSSCYSGPRRRGTCSSRSAGASLALHRLDAATKLPLPRRPPHSVSLSVPRRERGGLRALSSHTTGGVLIVGT